MTLSSAAWPATAVVAAITATVSLTVAYAGIFEPFRKLLRGLPLVGRFFRGLFQCPFCISHWVALALVLYFDHRPIATGRGEVPDVLMSVLLVVVCAAPVAWVIFNSYSHETD